MTRIPDKRPRNWFFTTCKLIRQSIKSNFHDFYARTLPHAVSELFACDVKPTTIQQRLLVTSVMLNLVLVLVLKTP